MTIRQSAVARCQRDISDKLQTWANNPTGKTEELYHKLPRWMPREYQKIWMAEMAIAIERLEDKAKTLLPEPRQLTLF